MIDRPDRPREDDAMYKLYALWTHPEDVEGFERHYVEVHAPLAAAIPGLQRLALTRTSDALGDDPSPYHRIAELWFEDAEALDRAAESPELEAAANDAKEMQERFGVQLLSPAGVSVDSPLGPYVPRAGRAAQT
jgi:uncharacterized protein (TIGR02118 family)